MRNILQLWVYRGTSRIKMAVYKINISSEDSFNVALRLIWIFRYKDDNSFMLNFLFEELFSMTWDDLITKDFLSHFQCGTPFLKELIGI